MNHSRLTGMPTLLAILLCGDLLFLLVYALCSFGDVPDSNMFSLGWDGGYPEMYQYLKLASSALLLLRGFLASQQIGLIVWALLFSYLLLDDSLRIHERAGVWMTVFLLGSAAATDPWRHVVELGFSVGVAMLLIGLLLPFYRTGTPRFRSITRVLALFLIALGFFGVAFDLVNSLAGGGWLVKGFLSTVEEAGEMLVLSFTLGYLLFLRNEGSAEDARLSLFLRAAAENLPLRGRCAGAGRAPVLSRAITPLE